MIKMSAPALSDAKAKTWPVPCSWGGDQSLMWKRMVQELGATEGWLNKPNVRYCSRSNVVSFFIIYIQLEYNLRLKPKKESYYFLIMMQYMTRKLG